ncbi:TIR-like protein FxsC [Streptomyces sp. NPDC060028]|uniref:TIR-like protein FxsC n=1 Tax=Streptomyces sp. NPDC060028 TaxID=3347041 RepID=UPI0036CBD8AC
MTDQPALPDATVRLVNALRPFQRHGAAGDGERPGVHAEVLVDRSPTMAVWRDDLDVFGRALIGLGAFRSVRIGDLPSAGGPAAWPAAGAAADRLLILVSDCASSLWREPAWWQELYALLHQSPTALVNPLPPRLWRHTGLDLPAVRVEPPRATARSNAGLPFTPPALLHALPEGGRGGPSWVPLPVMSLTSHGLGQWARTLTAESAGGCDALLVPGPSAWTAAAPRQPPHTAASLADSYLLSASPRAARIAVLCAAYKDLDLVHLKDLTREFEPEAGAADIAEILVGGLFSVTGGEPTTLRFRDGVRERIQMSLGVRDVRLLRDRLPHYAERLVERRRGGGPPTPRTSSGHRPSARETRPPYFFLSYAHTPRFGAGRSDPDMWVQRLFRDLCSHVMALTDLPAGSEAGFMDRETRGGEGRSERLGAALATCRVFVPLFSPRYFASEMCGKEWYAFAQRAIQHGAVSNQPAEAIVPALWVPVPPSQLPGPAERLQFNHNTFGERYVTDGLYGLIKLRGYAEQYERAVYELARRIVGVAETVRLDPSRTVDHRTMPSAFGAPGRSARSLRIIIAAPSRHDLPEGRSHEYYGDSAQEWNPYHPVSRRPIAYVAEDMARNLDYQVTVSSFDDEEAGHFDGRQAPAQPEILIVDRWMVEDESRRRRLAAFDRTTRPWTSVIVPHNRHDHQSRARENELAYRLEEIMPVKMGQGRAACRAAANGVANMETLGQILPQVVGAAAEQFLRHAQVYPPAGTIDTQRRPRLLGPKGMLGPPVPPPTPFGRFPGPEEASTDDE